MTEERLIDFVRQLFKNADKALADYRKDRSDSFASGSTLAYYEMLDILRSELDATAQDLKKYGLDVNLVRDYTG